MTLVGPGGAGKTRLANETAERLAARFPGGVQVATLAPLDEPSDLAQSVANGLGIRERTISGGAGPVTPRDALTRLADGLSGPPTLLVLDNCEHLVEAAAELADDLLAALPAPARPGHEPGAARHRRRGALAGAAARSPRTRHRCRGRHGHVRGASVRRPRGRGPARVRRRRVQRRGGHRGVPTPRRPAAGDRARGRTATHDGRRADRCASRRPVPVADRRQPYGRFRGTGPCAVSSSWSWDLLDDAERSLAERIAVFPGGVTPESAHAVAGVRLRGGGARRAVGAGRQVVGTRPGPR